MVIESEIHHENELETLFSVLKKSGGSLKFLGLHQDNSLNSKTRKLAMKHLPVLDSLITESGLVNFQLSVRYLLSRRPKHGIKDQDDESNSGLRMYVTDYLSELLEEDTKWLSNLQHLQVAMTGSSEDLLLLIKSCQDVLTELDLSQWEADDEMLEEIGPDPSFDFRRTRIRLKNLKDLALPHSKTSALCLGLHLELTGSEMVLNGPVPSLKSFKSCNLLSPRTLWIYLANQNLLPRQGYKSLKGFETAIMTLFKKNQIVENVSMDCPDDDASEEEKEYFKAILEKLCLRANAEEPKLERGKGQDRVERNVHQFFPFMTRLDVREPSPFAQVLLKKLLQSRREHSSDFQLRAMDELGDEVSDWEGRSW